MKETMLEIRKFKTEELNILAKHLKIKLKIDSA